MGIGEDVLFQNIGTKIYTCLVLDANCYCYFPLFIYKCRPRRPYFEIYLYMPFLSFLLVELVRMVRVCAISHSKYACDSV